MKLYALGKSGKYSIFDYIEYLNKVDSKARQTEADVLILEELEKWNEQAGNTALYTMIRHFDCFIVLSNQLPRWARVFFDTFNATYIRIDYWENEALEPAIKEALEEVEQYRALGTVEELKEAKEKQIPKKPESKQRFADLWLGVCPSCTANGVNSGMDYCDKCGQAIDWSEGE